MNLNILIPYDRIVILFFLNLLYNTTFGMGVFFHEWFQNRINLIVVIAGTCGPPEHPEKRTFPGSWPRKLQLFPNYLHSWWRIVSMSLPSLIFTVWFCEISGVSDNLEISWINSIFPNDLQWSALFGYSMVASVYYWMVIFWPKIRNIQGNGHISTINLQTYNSL